MKLLHFIRAISDSEEEFLAIIQEMNSWVQNNEEENEQRFIYMPHNLSRFNFSREEYRKAIDISIKAFENTEAHRDNKQNIASNRENQNTSPSTLFF